MVVIRGYDQGTDFRNQKLVERDFLIYSGLEFLLGFQEC